MSNEEKLTLKIDAIYPERGEIMLSGKLFTLGERIQLQYYKVGFWEECTIRDGVVTFMKKVQGPSTPAPASGTGTLGGFTSADQIKQPSQKREYKDSTPSMIWCNAMTNAIEILRLEVQDLPLSDMAELNLTQLAIDHAVKLHKAGMEHVKGDHV